MIKYIKKNMFTKIEEIIKVDSKTSKTKHKITTKK